MSITQDELVAVLNARLVRSEEAADLTSEIRNALRGLSQVALWPCLATTDETQSVESGTTTLSHPSDMRQFDKIVLNDGTYDGDPLERITFDEYLQEREGETSADYEEPLYFAERGESFYLYPVADGEYTPTIYYWRYHPYTDETTDIEFGEGFRTVLEAWVMMEYLAGLGLSADPKFLEQKAKRDEALALVLPDAEHPIAVVKYRDI